MHKYVLGTAWSEWTQKTKKINYSVTFHMSNCCSYSLLDVFRKFYHFSLWVKLCYIVEFLSFKTKKKVFLWQNRQIPGTKSSTNLRKILPIYDVRQNHLWILELEKFHHIIKFCYIIIWFLAIRIAAGLLHTGYNRCIAHIEYSNIL